MIIFFMYTESQTTILNEVSFFGKPENMEKIVNVKILPAQVDTGIIFRRVDFKENNEITVNYDNAFIENDKLVIKNKNGVCVNNIELLLASIWALKIDNVIIELDGDSLPFIDGTSEPLLFLLAIANKKELDKKRKIFILEQEIGARLDDHEINVKPSQSFSISVQDNAYNSFTYNAIYLPYKDWLSKVAIYSDDKNKIKADIVSCIAIIFISNAFSLFEVDIKNFDKKMAFNFFKNLFDSQNK